MNRRRISTIALSNRRYQTLEEKLDEVCRWISLAARQGCDLAVLPEYLNAYQGDGPDAPSIADASIEEAVWPDHCRKLLDCATHHQIAVTVPIMIRKKGSGATFENCFYLWSAKGKILGRYVKQRPTSGELAAGVVPGTAHQSPIDWDGIKVGGGICFDLNFREVFEQQKAAGVQLFLCPSLFPGGDQVNYYAASLQRPFVIAYPAWSRIIDRLGRNIIQGGYRHETLRFGFGVPVYTMDINFDSAVFHFDFNQEKIETILRKYGSDVRLDFDQDNCRFVLESCSDRFTIEQIIAENALLPLDKYLAGLLPQGK